MGLMNGCTHGASVERAPLKTAQRVTRSFAVTPAAAQAVTSKARNITERSPWPAYLARLDDDEE